MTIDRQTSVFINCPYDAEYQKIFDALLYAIVVCGFYPKSALSAVDAGTSRMERIARVLRDSKYSIHDLSRCKGEGDENLARFNMPLELGIAMGQKYFLTDIEDEHDWCLLVKKDSDYKRFVSDLSGYDPKEYDGEVKSALQAIMGWLVVQNDAQPNPPSPKKLMDSIDDYYHAVKVLREEWGEVPWTYLVKAAIDNAVQADLIPGDD